MRRKSSASEWRTPDDKGEEGVSSPVKMSSGRASSRQRSKTAKALAYEEDHLLHPSDEGDMKAARPSSAAGGQPQNRRTSSSRKSAVAASAKLSGSSSTYHETAQRTPASSRGPSPAPGRRSAASVKKSLSSSKRSKGSGSNSRGGGGAKGTGSRKGTSGSCGGSGYSTPVSRSGGSSSRPVSLGSSRKGHQASSQQRPPIKLKIKTSRRGYNPSLVNDEESEYHYGSDFEDYYVEKDNYDDEDDEDDEADNDEDEDEDSLSEGSAADESLGGDHDDAEEMDETGSDGTNNIDSDSRSIDWSSQVPFWLRTDEDIPQLTLPPSSMDLNMPMEQVGGFESLSAHPYTLFSSRQNSKPFYLFFFVSSAKC